MPAFLKLNGVDGEATDAGHKNWVIIESMSSPIFRSIPGGAKDNQRTRGETTLGDVVIVRQLDKSSVPLQRNCANGTFYPDVEIHFCTTVKNKQEPYLKYKLSNAIISSYSLHANSSGSPLPSEQFTIAYTKVEWTYVTVDPSTGDNKGSTVGSYDLGKGEST